MSARTQPLSTASSLVSSADRVEFETLLSDISAQLISVTSELLEETILSALGSVRCFFQADRCGLLSSTANLDIVRVAYGAFEEGVSHVSSEVNLAIVFPWIWRRLMVDRMPVVISRLADLPSEASVDRANCEAMPTRSFLNVPIQSSTGKLYVVVINRVHEDGEWPEEFVPRLRLLGEMLVNALERERALVDLRLAQERLEHENMYLRKEVQERLGAERIDGRSAAIRRTLELAEQVAATDSTVLLLGETGTGKERFASYIHEHSWRGKRPMIRVNCSAIPTSLIESELFGREKGAYTGALSKQIGRFELAHASTLFLDEIGELPIEMQVKLLRVLESRTIERLGNPRPIPVDVRIIAATNRNLAGAIRDGRFRQDLFYRLNIFPISIPPLRERPEDIPLFIDAFTDELSGRMGKRIEKVDTVCLEAAMRYAWPGNVRELRNTVERAMILTTGSTLRLFVPETETCEVAPENGARAGERAHLLQVLNDTGWRIRGAHGAAMLLGLNPTTLESRIKKLGLIRPGTH